MSSRATLPNAPCAMRNAFDIFSSVRDPSGLRPGCPEDAAGTTSCVSIPTGRPEKPIFSVRHDPRQRALRILLQSGGEIDGLDALHMDALELQRAGYDRLGGVQPHLSANSVVRRWVELRSLRPRNDQKVAVGLEPGCDRPFDLVGIVDV